MGQNQLTDFSPLQKLKKFRRRKVGQFADEHIARSAEWIGEIRRRAEIGGHNNAPVSRLKCQAENLEAVMSLRIDLLLQSIKVRGGKRCHPHAGSNAFHASRLPWPELQGKSKERGREKNGFKPGLQWRNQFHRQINRQRFTSWLQPRRLQKHRQAARVVGMSMGNEQRIDIRHRNPQFAKALTARLAGIDQHIGLGSAQQRRGTESSPHGNARSRAEEEQRMHGCLLSVVVHPRKSWRLPVVATRLNLRVHHVAGRLPPHPSRFPVG